LLGALISMLKDAASTIVARRRDAFERRRGYKRALLDRVAERIGIKRIEADDAIGDSLAGWVDGFYVEVQPSASRHGMFHRVRVEIDSEGEIPESITIGPKLLWDEEFEREILAPRRPKPLIPADTHPKGQLPEVSFPIDQFGSSIYVGGDTETAYALLDDRARKEVLAIVGERGVWIASGAIIWEGGRSAAQADLLVEMTTRMLALAQKLTIERRDIPLRLSQNARGDPSPAMRHQNLVLLIAHHPSAEETLVACRNALNDIDVFVRLLAAKHLGDEGMPALRGIVHAEYAHEEARVLAVQHLAKNHPRSAAEVLAKLLWSSSSRVMFASLRGLLYLDPALVRRTEIEVRLIDLASSSDRSMNVTAVDLLARVGGGRALASLHALAKGMFNDAGVKEAARSAIEAIEARLGAAESGRLSIVDPLEREGALSVATEEGAVSLAKKA
jgi:hypothetical protein